MPHGGPKKLRCPSSLHEDPGRHEPAARWVSFLVEHGIEASHWSVEGDMRAPDTELLWWARERGCIVLTHDLDFGLLLSMTQESGPSVIQVRTQDVTPEAIGSLVLTALRGRAEALARGALLSIQNRGARVRVLPIEDPGRGSYG
jgi:predicted nuclease of predicted toxin-antitoxin system